MVPRFWGWHEPAHLSTPPAKAPVILGNSTPALPSIAQHVASVGEVEPVHMVILDSRAG